MASLRSRKPALISGALKIVLRGSQRPVSKHHCIRNSAPSFGPFSAVRLRHEARPHLQQIQRRPYSRRYELPRTTWRTKLQAAAKDNPVWLSISVISLITSVAFVFYTFVYYPRQLARDFHGFPDRVAAKLRLALWYTHDNHWNPDKALLNYREALKLAQKLKMDPYGDQYFGMRLKVAGFFEKLGNFPRAIELLEQDRSIYLSSIEAISTRSDLEERRGQILFKAVALHAKLAEYYSHEQMHDDEAAEERLVWAVTTILKERERTGQSSTVSPDTDVWITDEQIGGTLEALANFYESRNRHFLCAPLYLQALTFSPPKSCHTAVLMNNLASSLALQRTPPNPNIPEPSATDQISSARSWVHRALKTAAEIKSPERTEECDEACAVATINLGDLALMEGDFVEARRRFEEARSLCKAMGYKEGLEKVADSLRQIHDR